MMVTLARHVGRYEGVMFKMIAITISAVALVMLAIALAPAVPTALATARTTTTYEGDPTLNQPLADQSCARFQGLVSLSRLQTQARQEICENEAPSS